MADKIVPMILERAKAIRFGDPQDPETQLGCVIHSKAAETFENRVYDAEKQGAKILYHPERKVRCCRRSWSITCRMAASWSWRKRLAHRADRARAGQ